MLESPITGFHINYLKLKHICTFCFENKSQISTSILLQAFFWESTDLQVLCFPGWKFTEQGRQSTTVSTKKFWWALKNKPHIWSITTTTEIQFLLSVISEIRQKGKHSLANSPYKPLVSISQDAYSFSYKFLVLVLSPHAF